MKYNKFNVSKPEKYESNGEEKTRWNNVGVMTEFLNDDGSVKSRIINIPAISLDAHIFPMDTERANAPAQTAQPSRKVEMEDIADMDFEAKPSNDEIDPEDIPF
jgi:hypothetical protein